MIILIALAVATISMTLTQSSLFRVIQRCKLLRCPYCMAHYISFFIWSGYVLGGYVPQHPKTMTLFDFVINVFATVALSVLPMMSIDYFNTRMDKHAKILHSTGRTLH